jgi:tRNA pseudouridine38-40 synthase
MRIALGIEYDGSRFLGWQSQKQAPTVQDTLEAALSCVADEPLRIVCAGRTDTGVHAHGQVVHFDTDAQRTQRQWILGLNSNLPDDIRVTWARPVTDDFHARFSAFARTYRYSLINRWVRPAINGGRIGWCRWPLNEELMHCAAQYLLGEHDFSAFRSAGCQARHALREISSISVRRDGLRIDIEITANGFLYHMVRNIVGSLIPVGKGEKAPEWIAELLQGRDRTVAGSTAGAEGLSFVSVRYPAQFGLPEFPQAFPEFDEPPEPDESGVKCP